MKALITGATGFIGSHLAERLLRAGHDVTCLVRNRFDLKWIGGLEVRVVEGDCSRNDTLDGCTKDYDYVFHLAGLTKAAHTEDFYSVNARGTENLVQSVMKNSPDIRRLVYVSSLAARGPRYGGANGPGPVSEYGKSKLMGEHILLEHKSRVPVTVLRPAAVYGPRDRDFFVIFRFVKNRVVPYRGGGRLSLVYVDDLTDAVVRAAERIEAEGKTYTVSDGMIYSSEEVIDGISSALGVKVLKLGLPDGALTAAGLLGDMIGKISAGNSIINSDKVRELKHDWICDNTEAARDLGFQPGTGLREGVKWTADWYRNQKWL